MTTLEQVSKVQKMIFDKAHSLVAIKGADYNREQQQQGDTLFNLRVSKLLGISDTDTQSILVRLGDKFMRLVSLTKKPNTKAKVKNESVLDTIVDVFNYTSYLYIFYCEQNGLDPLTGKSVNK